MPGAEDSVVLKLKVELEESEKAFKDYKTRLSQLKREKSKDNKAERVELQRKVNEESKLHKTKLNQIKELRAARRIENSVWLKDLTKIPEQLGQKYQAWARRNPEAAAMFRGVRTAGKLIGRPAIAGARLGAGVAASGISGLLGMLIGGIQQGYQTYLSVGQAMGSITGMGAGRRPMGAAIGRGVGMGFRPSETWAQAAQVGRATGAPEAVTLAQRFALGGGGMQVGEAAGIMGQLRQAGVEFNAPNRAQSSQLLGKLIEKGLLTGLEKARLPEYLKGVSSMAEMVGGRQAGKVDVDTIATTLSYLGRIPGMQGQRGVSLMQTIDQAIKSPGGGEAGQQLMLQAMGFGKPGGETPYYEAVKRQQRGITGIGGAQNLVDVFKEIQAQYGPLGKGSQSQEANLAAQTAMPGLTLDMIESIGEMINSGKSQEDILKGIEDQTKKFRPIEDRVVDAIKEGFQGVRIRLAGQEAKSANIGAKSAKLVEELQDLHHDVLKILVDIMKNNLPAILEAIKEMRGYLKSVAEWITGKTTKEGLRKEFGVKGALGGMTGAEVGASPMQARAASRTVLENLLAGKRKLEATPEEEVSQAKGLTGWASQMVQNLLGRGRSKTEVKKELMGEYQQQIAQAKQRQRIVEELVTLRGGAKWDPNAKKGSELQGQWDQPWTPEELEQLKSGRISKEFRQRAIQKQIKPAKTSALTPEETGEADPFAPGGAGRLASLAQTGQAGVRMVEGRVLIPVPYHPRTSFKGAPGSGEGETV